MPTHPTTTQATFSFRPNDAPPACLTLPVAPFPEDIHIGRHEPPRGFIELTQNLREKGLLPDSDTRVAFRAGSDALNTLRNAIDNLPANVPLTPLLITGISRNLIESLTTLLRHGVISPQQLLTGHQEHFDSTNRAPTTELAHLVATFGSEVQTDEAAPSGLAFDPITLKDRFKELEAAGFSPRTEDQNRLTAAHHAAAHGNIETLRALRDAGVDLFAPNSEGLTPLHSAAAHRDGAQLEVPARGDVLSGRAHSRSDRQSGAMASGCQT